MTKPFPRFDHVTVFGGATVDRIGRSKAPAVAGSSNPGTVRAMIGGVGLNVATSLARLGVPTALVARVGADADGEAIIARARSAGIDTSGIGVSTTAPTATYHAAFDSDGSLIVGVADMEVYGELRPAAVADRTAAAPARDLWVMDTNLPAETLAFVAEEAHAANRPLVALSVSPVKALQLAPVIGRLALLIVNRREAAAILGRPWSGKGPTAESLALALAGSGPAAAIVTDSSEPLAVASGTETRSFASLRARVRSVNGAGDALAAGTIYGLSTNLSLLEAIPYGLAAAALIVESEETTRLDLTPDLLAARLGAGQKASP